MTKALILFRQSYARDLAASVVSSLEWLDVRAIVGSIAEVAEILDNEYIDVLLIGPTFIERVDALLAKRCGGSRPLVVVLDRTTEASVRARAAGHRVDRVITAAGGLGVMLEELRACVLHPADCTQGPTTRNEGFESAVIFVSDETDREIVQLVASGFTDREIAEIVNYSHQTVRNRLSRILGDSGARNRTHLACMYLTLVHDGIVPFNVA